MNRGKRNCRTEREGRERGQQQQPKALLGKENAKLTAGGFGQLDCKRLPGGGCQKGKLAQSKISCKPGLISGVKHSTPFWNGK